MRSLLYFAFLCCQLNLSCSKTKDYQDPLAEERLSVEFLIPPSIGSPYKVGDPIFITLVMTANKVQVTQVDVMFSDQLSALANVQLTNVNSSPIANDNLWTMRYTAGTTITLPSNWAGKTITVTALANGISAKSAFEVK